MEYTTLLLWKVGIYSFSMATYLMKGHLLPCHSRLYLASSSSLVFNRLTVLDHVLNFFLKHISVSMYFVAFLFDNKISLCFPGHWYC